MIPIDGLERVGVTLNTVEDRGEGEVRSGEGRVDLDDLVHLDDGPIDLPGVIQKIAQTDGDLE